MYYPPICDQRFIVRNESGSPIDNAEVIALKSVQTGFWRVTSTTTSDGGAILTLDEGDTYTATAIKDGYKCVSCSKTFKPCIGRITFTLKESYMGTPKACIYLQDPSSSRTVNVGDYVTIRMGIKNCGTARGNLYGIIHKSGTECVQKTGWFDPGEVLKLYGRECDIPNMPNSTVKITFYGGHWSGSAWIQDFSKTITLTPSPVTGRLHVTSSPTGASIYLSEYPYTSNIYKGTTPKTITNLNATTYKVTCKKSGYVTQFKWATVIANSTVNVSFTLEPIIEYCNQPFRVVDASTGVGINGAWVEVVGVDKRITSTTGYVTFRLIKNKSYTAIATKSGYNSVTKTFSASTSQVTLRLAKIVTTGTLRINSTPVQGADIYINDIKQSYKTNHDFTLEAGHYDVNIKLTGYKEPALQGVTVVSSQTKTLTFTLEEEAPPPPKCADLPPEECLLPCYLWSDNTCHDVPEPSPCSEYTDEESCILAGCSWYDGFCHKYTPVKCSDYKDAITCEDNLCRWWAKDGTCHDTEEPTIGMIESIDCIAEKEAEGKYEISADITVKNITDEDKRFYIALYDAVTDNHLGDEPDEFEPTERLIEAGGSKVFHIDTYDNPLAAATTPSLRYDLWYAPILGLNEIADSRTEDCTEKDIGEILSITCTSTKEAENDYEIEAIVKFKNPDTILHLYKVELLDAETGDSKDHEPNIYESGKEVAAGETSTIRVDTTASNCISPKIFIKLWETTGFKALVDEQEKDCSEAEPTMFASLISFLMDSFSITEPQAKLLVYGSGGILALSFIMPMLRR